MTACLTLRPVPTHAVTARAVHGPALPDPDALIAGPCALPAAPLAMPAQVIEPETALIVRLARLVLRRNRRSARMEG